MEKGFNWEKERISLFFVESPNFFHGSPDFPLPGVGRSANVAMSRTKPWCHLLLVCYLGLRYDI